MLDAAPGRALNIMGVCPATVDVMAGAAPLNGTCVMSRLSESRNSSPASCPVVPVPGDVTVLTRIGLHDRDEFLNCFSRNSGIDGQHMRGCRCECHGGEVANGIVRKLRIEARID